MVAVSGAADKLIQGKITYLTQDQVYCDIGSGDDLSVGDTLTVFRRTEELGKIIVTNLATHSSVSSSLIPTTEYQLGDRVQLVKSESDAGPLTIQDSTQVPIQSEPEKIEPKEKLIKHNGNIGLRHSSVAFSDNKTSKRSVSTLQYGISTIGNFKSSLWVYGRGDMIDQSFTLYQARMTLGDPNGPISAQVGRVFASELAGMGATDGLMAKWNPSGSFGIGAIAGVQPDPISLAFNKDIHKGGLFGHIQKKVANVYMNTRIALVGQYASGSTDREFSVFHVSLADRRWWDFRTNATVDFYRDAYISTRNKYSVTNSELSLRIRAPFNVSFSSRLSTNRMVIYRSSSQTFVDSLFEDEMRTGLYNTLQYRHPHFGKFSLGANLRVGSTDRPSTVVRFNYGTGDYMEKSYGDVTLMYLQNFLITGIRSQIGLGMPIGQKGNVYGQFEYYTYGYGNMIADYSQQTVSGNFSYRIGKQVSLSASMDYTYEVDFKILYMYFGGSYRF